MTVTASGAITFSNIMNEFNPGGGQSNIKLGDYLGRDQMILVELLHEILM